VQITTSLHSSGNSISWFCVCLEIENYEMPKEQALMAR